MDTSTAYPLFLLGIGVVTIFVLILVLRINAFLALIGAALVIGLLSPRVVGAGLDFFKVVGIITSEFGNLMGGIGISIALATIVGLGLMESGAADRIVRAFTRLFGERFAPLALLFSGFALAIPVFFDTVFFLLVPLAKAMRLRTGKNYLLYLTAIGAGGAVAHSMVPPTPGPIAMAEALGVDLGMTIIVGIMVGLPVSFIGFGYAILANKLWPVELRQVGDTSLEELEKQAHRPDSELPGLVISLMPIVLPVLLITSFTVYTSSVQNGRVQSASYEKDNAIVIKSVGHGLESGDQIMIQDVRGNTAANGTHVVTTIDKDHFSLDDSQGNSTYKGKGSWFINPTLASVGGSRLTTGSLLAFFGDKNIALLVAAIVAMLMVVQRCGYTRDELGSFTAKALDAAGMILLITCAGGAFGGMLRDVGVGDSLNALSQQWGISALVLAWGVAAMMKIAQGSGTVAMITASGIIAGAVDPATLPYHPVYLIMAIGVGSKIASWMNDSGFWVVCKMGGLTEGETFKSWTMTLIVMGFAGLPIVWFLSVVLPLK